MSGISRITAMEIRGNEVLCDAHGPAENGKFEGWIYMLRGGEIHKPMLNSDARYDTPEIAIIAMEEVVKSVRDMTDEELYGKG